jgi:hypothetical protein
MSRESFTMLRKDAKGLNFELITLKGHFRQQDPQDKSIAFCKPNGTHDPKKRFGKASGSSAES